MTLKTIEKNQLKRESHVASFQCGAERRRRSADDRTHSGRRLGRKKKTRIPSDEGKGREALR